MTIKMPQVPIASIILYAGKINSNMLKTTGWLKCDGQALQINEYPELYQAIGYTYSRNVPEDRFRIPKIEGIKVENQVMSYIIFARTI